MGLLDELNDKQYEAVVNTEGPCLVIAGAGSGKTRVLTTRIAFLVDEIGADPKKIAAITFTNKAAREMKQRVETMLGVKGFGVHISTIHALCVRILREDIMCMNMPKNFTVLDADDQKSVLKEAYKELEIDVKNLSYSAALDYISPGSDNIDLDKVETVSLKILAARSGPMVWEELGPTPIL